MIKIKNSFAIKKWVRILLIAVIFVQLTLVFIQLWEYFFKLVIQGISTSSFKTESNILVRLLNYFEVGVGSIIREYVVNICIPALLFVFLRDRDREIMLEAVKEGVIEGVEEIQHHNEIKEEPVKVTEFKPTPSATNLEDKKIKKNKKKTNLKKEVSSEEDLQLDDFFKTL